MRIIGPRRALRILRNRLAPGSGPGARRPLRPPQGAREVLECLVRVTERLPREYDPNYRALLQRLQSFASGSPAGVGEFEAQWRAFAQRVFTSPVALPLLFPERCAADARLATEVRKTLNVSYLPPPVSAARAAASPQAQLLDPEARERMLAELLAELDSRDPGEGAPFRYLSRYLFLRDLAVVHFIAPHLRDVQEALFGQCLLQRQNWRHSYADDYPYQGFARLGIAGVKPAEERLARYDVAALLPAGGKVLDIGANNGFLALAVADRVGRVDAIEFNPYLCEMTRIAARHLGVTNVEAIVGDFVEFRPASDYDAVFSLANHCTIDGNLSIDFEEYVAKCFAALKPGGHLLFESHNVFGPGLGGAGDDGDMDAKFDVVERYFEVVRHRMTERYVPAFDVDKLFVVLRRRLAYKADAVRTFRLAEARARYAY